MSKLRTQLPDAAAVQARLKDALIQKLSGFVAHTKIRRSRFVRSRLYAIISFCFLVAVTISLFAFSVLYPPPLQIALFSMLLIWTAGMISFGHRWFENEKLLAREMNMAMIPIIMYTLDRTVIYSHNELHRSSAAQLLEQSKLFALNGFEVVSDDMYSFFNPSMTVNELKIVPSSSQSLKQPTVPCFAGMLITATLSRTLSGTTIISTRPTQETNTTHDVFWDTVVTNSSFHDITAAIDSLPAGMHVATSHREEAEAVLSTPFIAELASLAQTNGGNIRVSLRGNMLFVLVPNVSVLIKSSTSSTSQAMVGQYAESIVVPLWQAVRVVEEVRT